MPKRSGLQGRAGEESSDSPEHHDSDHGSWDNLRDGEVEASTFHVSAKIANEMTKSLSPERNQVDRNLSSPTMPAFMTSAPGKAIVYGEHAVVHGRAALAAAVSLRSYLLVTTLSTSQRTVSLEFPDISFSHTWQVDALPWAVFSQSSKKKHYYDLVTSLDPDLTEALQPHLSVSPHVSAEQRKIHCDAAFSFLYLLLSLGHQGFPGCIYTLRSTLPIGAGLGSSASISVCLSSALLLQMRTLASPHSDQPPEEARLQIERINRWAFVGELCIHRNPSGVDNTVATNGKAILFKRYDYTKPPSLKVLHRFPELPLLLVNTKQPRSTATEVAKVGALCQAHPEIAEHILDAINKITESAKAIISGDGFDPRSASSSQVLGDLMNINHGLLVALGVSHPRLERIRELVDSAKLGWTKLTGAGGGGSAITLLKPEASPEALKLLEAQLDEEDFERFETTLGGNGVGVLWPAVLHNSKDDTGGEEIDQEKFIKAEGREGVEKLVGIGANQAGKGWKFWNVGY